MTAIPAENMATSASARRARKRRRFLKRLTAATSGGFFMDGFVFASIAVVMASQAFRADLAVTPVWQGLISASTLVGTLLGGPVLGYITDRLGRRPLFLLDPGVFLISTVLLYFAGEPWQIVVLGLVLGGAIGADYAIGPSLLGEFAPVDTRGRYVGALEIFWNLGYVVAYLTGFLITRAEPGAWRWALAAGAVPALVLMLLRRGIPESPRWLVSKGRADEAREIVRGHLAVELEDTDILGETSSDTQWRTLFTRDYVLRTIFCATFWICIVLPYFALTFFEADVLRTLGVTDPVASAVLGTVVALVGAVAGWLLVDKIGRRKLLILPMFATTVALALVSASSQLPELVTILCFFGYLFFYGVMSILPGVYPLEVFPTALRTSGTGFASAASRAGAAVGTFLLPLAMISLGFAPTLLLMAAVCLIGGVSSALLAPETNGRSLTETTAKQS